MELNLENKKTEDKICMAVNVYESTHKRLKLLSAQSGETMQNIIRHALNEVLPKLESQINK